jgi:outer membrane protein
MNRNFVILAALAAGLLPVAAVAQVSPAPPAPASPASSSHAAAPATASGAPAQAAVTPQAIPAKIALIAFQQAVISTNEGQRAALEVQKKYEPQKAKLDQLAVEIDSLKKQLQALPATTTEPERAAREKSIDTKEKQYQRDVDDATTAYQTDVEEALGKVAQKVNIVLQAYVKTNGFTLLLDVSNQQSAVMWATPETDVTEAVIAAYNATSGVAAPPPAAPSAAHPSTTPRPAAPAAPKTATPKPPSQ